MRALILTLLVACGGQAEKPTSPSIQPEKRKFPQAVSLSGPESDVENSAAKGVPKRAIWLYTELVLHLETELEHYAQMLEGPDAPEDHLWMMDEVARALVLRARKMGDPHLLEISERVSEAILTRTPDGVRRALYWLPELEKWSRAHRVLRPDDVGGSVD